MKKRNVWVFFTFVFAVACGPAQKVTSSWVKPDRPAKTYSTVFVAALVQDTELKMSLENDLAAAATAKGYKVVKAADVFPPNFTRQNLPDRETALSKIRSLNCDAIFTVAIVDKQSESRYVPGTTTYAPFRAYGRGFWGYYSYAYPVMYQPGYYTTDKTYFLEGNAFDVASEEMIWSVQSEAYNPSSKKSLAKGYTAVLVKEFEKVFKK